MRINTGLLRARLALLRARYDHGAVSGSIYKCIKQLEADIAWLEHHELPIDRNFVRHCWPMKNLKRRK